MKSKRKMTLFALQLVAFLFVSFIALNIIIYFPNLPTALSPYIGKYRVAIDGSNKADKRFLKWFNRDPERNIPNKKNIIVSPADGVVEKVITKEKSKHIVIEMRYTDIHVQRIPISGKLVRIIGGGKELEKGYDLLDYELDKMLPFQKITVFETEIGIVKVRQITSFFAKRIEVFLKEEQYYKIGTRLGKVLAGSTIVIELPESVNVVTKVQDELIAGESIIATY